MATTVTYEGNTIATVENTTKTLQTKGTWLTDDITLTDTSAGGGEWTTAGIANNTEPNGTITLKPWNKGNGYIFAANHAFHAKAITKVIFDFENNSRLVNGASACFAESQLKEVELINTGNGASWRFESTFNQAQNLEAFETDIPINFGGYSNAFSGCSRLKRLSVPNAFGAMFVPCQTDYLLEYADMGSAYQLNGNGFQNCHVLQTLILRKSDAIVALGNVSAFQNTPMRGYNGLTGKIYVPSALISTYQTATNWATIYAEGFCEFVAIEGSPYEL